MPKSNRMYAILQLGAIICILVPCKVEDLLRIILDIQSFQFQFVHGQHYF